MNALEEIATWIKPSPLRKHREYEANQQHEAFRKVLLKSPVTPIPDISDDYMERNTTSGISKREIEESIKVNAVQKPATPPNETQPLHISNMRTMHKIAKVSPPQHGDMGITQYLGYRRVGLQHLSVVLFAATVQHITNVNFLFPPSVIYVPQRLQQEYLTAIAERDSNTEPGIFNFYWHKEIHKIRILNENDFSEWLKIHLHSSIDRDMVYTGA